MTISLWRLNLFSSTIKLILFYDFDCSVCKNISLSLILENLGKMFFRVCVCEVLNGKTEYLEKRNAHNKIVFPEDVN